MTISATEKFNYFEARKKNDIFYTIHQMKKGINVNRTW